MTDHANPNVNDVLPNVPAVGALAFNRFTFDFAASYAPAAVDLADRIQIGVVPAGQVLVPHLSRISIPVMEGGTPASDYTIGTEDDPDALKGTAASETAVVLTGEDILVSSDPIGHPDEDTPIYITVETAAFDAVAATGKIVFEPVTRAWRDDIDVVPA